MGGRLGWPVVLGGALLGACVGALATWATLAGGGVVRGALPTPASWHVSIGPSEIRTPNAGGEKALGKPTRIVTASAVQLDAAYDFDIHVDYASGSAHVVERLRVTNLGESAGALQLFVLPHFDSDGFREFELRSLQVEGASVPVQWTQKGANLVVPLAPPLRHGATTELRIEFSLHAGSAVDSAQVASVSKARGLMQLLLWYPILSDGHGVVADGDPVGPTPVSDVRYTIRSDEPVDLAVPGQISSESSTLVTGRLEHARDFAFAVSPAFTTWPGRSGETSVEVDAPEGTHTADGAVGLGFALAALDRIGRLLDAPYPAPRYVLVAGNMDMESSGIAFVNEASLVDPYKVAHETAHQWFPWLVGNDQLREPWLDEALVTYLGMNLHPRSDTYCSKVPVDSSVYRFPSVALELGWADCDGYIQTVYRKGSTMLAAIEHAMRRRAFVAALREYVATYRFQVASGADFVALLRRHTAAPLDELLRAWLSPTLSRGGGHAGGGSGPLP